MNFNQLKLGFLSFLEEKLNLTNTDGEKEKLNLSDISIFMYQDEFKEYLEQEEGIDESIFSKNFSDFASLEFTNGQFANNEKELTDEDNELVLNMLNDIMQDESFIKAYDNDKNGILEQKEAGNFINKINNKENEFSINDIFTGIEGQNNYNIDFIGDLQNTFTKEQTNTLGKIFDKNKDGIIADEEINSATKFLKMFDNQTHQITEMGMQKLESYLSTLEALGFTQDEIIQNILGGKGDVGNLSSFDILNLFGEGNSLIENLQEAALEGIQPNTVMEENGEGNPPERTHSSSGTRGGSGNFSPAIREKAIENMSIKELESELDNANAKVKETEESYKKEIEKIDKELAEKIVEVEENITTTENELNTANTELSENQTQLTNNQNALSTAQERAGSIDGEISKLEKEKEKDGANIKEIENTIKELKAEKEDIEQNQIPALQENIKQNEEIINELETNTIPTLETQLNKYNEEEIKLQEELNSLAGENNSLKKNLDAYKQALEYVNKIEDKLTIRQNDENIQGKVNYNNPEEAPKDYRNNGNIDITNMPLTYDLNGETYHCVGFRGSDIDGDGKPDIQFNSWEEAQRYCTNGGLANIGKYGSMQCHNYSDILGQFVLGKAPSEFSKALYEETNDPNYGDKDEAGRLGREKKTATPRRFAQCRAKNRDEERAIIENELQNGRPALVSVPGSGQHWVLAVGMNDDGDILIWDSYNSSMEKLGKSSNSDQNKLHRNMATSNGIMVYAEGYEYQYSSAKLIDYWQYVDNSPEYVLQNGYK